jgi:hypothetical protein
MLPGTRALALVAMILALAWQTSAASAQQIRTAKVGDPMASLLTGLIPVNGGPVGVCADGGPVLYYVNYLVSSRAEWFILGWVWRDLVPDNAAFLAYMAGDQVGKRIVMLVEFDQLNPSVPVQVFADMQATGNITNIWPAAQAPALCTVAQQLRASR